AGAMYRVAFFAGKSAPTKSEQFLDVLFTRYRPAGLPPCGGLGYTRRLFTEFVRVASPWKSNRS
ncbi:hypothetical protein ACIP1G_07140, partial [Pseudomonas sp. NPDC089392]|uniref:hypothetical protein n=1 Tax=Pseudomonas sp. NPDC089392 TaxID=3364459 RepID=UPI003822D25C